MKIFSSRYADSSVLRHMGYSAARTQPNPDFRYRQRGRTLLDSRLRQRVCFELRHIVSTYTFLEPYLLTKHLAKAKPSANIINLREFSLAEAGYDVTEKLDIQKMEIITYDDEGGQLHDDFALLDLIEILVIFCKEDKREDVVSRLNNIFKEQSSDFRLQGWMITLSGRETLSALIPLIKDDTLKDKLSASRSLVTGASTSAQVRARSAADALQFIYSGEAKSKTKDASQEIVNTISKEWTDDDNTQALASILTELVLLAKKMNNEIGNIRHTDKHTISTTGDSMFEMIYKVNIAIIHLSIVSDPTKYIENRKAVGIKNDYAKRYSIDLSVYKEVDETDDNQPIDLSTIPF